MISEKASSSELDAFLVKFNGKFGTSIHADSLTNARERCELYLGELKRSVPETDIPLYLSKSTDYACYLIGLLFGLYTASAKLIGYGSVGSRYLETMR